MKETEIGNVPRISSTLCWKDYLGTIEVRCDIGRMNYKVQPGLYALGEPDSASPIVSTANYKLSFDSLRSALAGQNAWVLVLDTQGINVWCAAGKGTFGTQELVKRISSSRVQELVSHRDLILPQLGASGVAAWKVKELSGFTVHYGPIRALDLPAYIEAGMKATPEMRLKTFSLMERMVLIPVEFVGAMKHGLYILPILFLLGGLGAGHFWQNACNSGIRAVLFLLASIVAGTFFVPALLPILPGRAFATKGLSLATLMTCILLFLYLKHVPGCGSNLLEILSLASMGASVIVYLAMNFTGASTYTSLSGVKKEMRWAVPCEIVLAATGLALWILSRFLI